MSGDRVSVQGVVFIMSAKNIVVLTVTLYEEKTVRNGNQGCPCFNVELFQLEMSDVILVGQKSDVSVDTQLRYQQNVGS